MMEFFNNIYNLIIEIVNSGSIYGIIFSCFLIFFESIIPVLPLFVFITILFISLGYFTGYLISYILTCLGCIFSFYLCRKFLRNYYENKIRKNNTLDKYMKIIDNISLNSLAVLIALPFTPAFAINIVSGLSKMSFKKYFCALIIGKIFMVAFWGFIGTSLLESLKIPKIIIIILIMLILTYVISIIVNKKLKIE